MTAGGAGVAGGCSIVRMCPGYGMNGRCTCMGLGMSFAGVVMDRCRNRCLLSCQGGITCCGVAAAVVAVGGFAGCRVGLGGSANRLVREIFFIIIFIWIGCMIITYAVKG